MTSDNDLSAPDMRRRDRVTSRAEALAISEAAPYGTLCCQAADGTPYATPINPAWLDGCLYWHSSATGGRRAAGLRRSPRAVISFVARAETLPTCFTVNFASALVSGRASEVSDPAERDRAIAAICARHAAAAGPETARRFWAERGHLVAIWRLDVEAVSGKRWRGSFRAGHDERERRDG